MSILSFDLTEVIFEELLRQRRKPDGLLHASSHLSGPLRHTQLDVAGAPKLRSAVMDEITLETGQLWHTRLHDMLRKLGVPYMAEVNVTPWLPAGWAGRPDAVIWNPDLKAFVLIDFKTQKGEGMRYILSDGAKEDHRYQTSIYWHGLKKMGLPLAKTVGVLYLPKNDTRNKGETIEPVLIDFEPIPTRQLTAQAKARRGSVLEYEESLPFIPTSVQLRAGVEPEDLIEPDVSLEDWLTDALAPESEREQKLFYDRSTETWDLKLVPHWTAAYCDYPDVLCACSKQGQTKIGMFDVDGKTYVPRNGYEDIEPTLFPTA